MEFYEKYTDMVYQDQKDYLKSYNAAMVAIDYVEGLKKKIIELKESTKTLQAEVAVLKKENEKRAGDNQEKILKQIELQQLNKMLNDHRNEKGIRELQRAIMKTQAQYDALVKEHGKNPKGEEYSHLNTQYEALKYGIEQVTNNNKAIDEMLLKGQSDEMIEKRNYEKILKDRETEIAEKKKTLKDIVARFKESEEKNSVVLESQFFKAANDREAADEGSRSNNQKESVTKNADQVSFNTVFKFPAVPPLVLKKRKSMKATKGEDIQQEETSQQEKPMETTESTVQNKPVPERKIIVSKMRRSCGALAPIPKGFKLKDFTSISVGNDDKVKPLPQKKKSAGATISMPKALESQVPSSIMKESESIRTEAKKNRSLSVDERKLSASISNSQVSAFARLCMSQPEDNAKKSAFNSPEEEQRLLRRLKFEMPPQDLTSMIETESESVRTGEKKKNRSISVDERKPGASISNSKPFAFSLDNIFKALSQPEDNAKKAFKTSGEQKQSSQSGSSQGSSVDPEGKAQSQKTQKISKNAAKRLIRNNKETENPAKEQPQPKKIAESKRVQILEEIRYIPPSPSYAPSEASSAPAKSPEMGSDLDFNINFSNDENDDIEIPSDDNMGNFFGDNNQNTDRSNGTGFDFFGSGQKTSGGGNWF